MEFQEQIRRSDSVMGSMENLLKANINSIVLLILFFLGGGGGEVEANRV